MTDELRERMARTHGKEDSYPGLSSRAADLSAEILVGGHGYKTRLIIVSAMVMTLTSDFDEAYRFCEDMKKAIGTMER